MFAVEWKISGVGRMVLGGPGWSGGSAREEVTDHFQSTNFLQLLNLPPLSTGATIIISHNQPLTKSFVCKAPSQILTASSNCLIKWYGDRMFLQCLFHVTITICPHYTVTWLSSIPPSSYNHLVPCPCLNWCSILISTMCPRRAILYQSISRPFNPMSRPFKGCRSG